MMKHSRGGDRRSAGASRIALLAFVVIAIAILPLVGLLLTPAPASALPAALRRYPYLTDLVNRHVTINWATRASIRHGHVRYGRVARHCHGHTATAHERLIHVGDQRERQWRVSVSHLLPGARYCYRIFGDGVDLLGKDRSPRFFAQLPDRSRKRYSFAVLGDWGQVMPDGRNRDQARVIGQLARSNARFVVMTGDTAYPNGSQRNYGDLVQEGNDTSAVFGPRFWPRAGDSIPAFVPPGNHGLNRTLLVNWPEHQAAASSHGRYRMERYCCVNRTRPHSYPSVWYAFDAGRARFYVLDAAWPNGNVGAATMYENDHDAHWRITSDEFRWLRHDLRTHRQRVSFAFLHFPFYSDNPSETSDPWLNGPNRLEGLLGRHGVDIVFNGHAHIYQRNARSASGMPATYVTGGGGGRLASVSGCDAFDRYAIGWSYSSMHGSACGAAPVPLFPDQVFHLLLVRVDGRTVTVRPLDEHGNAFDVHTYHV
jgi:hypothetical protein